ncbi:MAG: hypothetical protein IPH82_14420 [Chloroflexi bacterium]|nr:hypothetical protein [Chloroflexota bacterium]
MKENIQIGITILFALGVIDLHLVHTGGLLARYVDPPAIGYVAAFGIEAAVVSLSLRIGELRRSKQSTGFFYSCLSPWSLSRPSPTSQKGLRPFKGNGSPAKPFNN